MGSLSSWLRLYYLLKLIGQFYSYVLLAADADDFRNIAKKVVPENLANKLAQLASDVSVKKNSRGNNEDTDYYYDTEAEEFDEDKREDITTDSEVKDLRELGEDVYIKEWKTRVNFDELVERVKDRLAKELSGKLKKHILNSQNGISTKGIFNYKQPYNKVKQREIQNNRIKNSAYNKVDNSGSNYAHNSYVTENTYGYNNLKYKQHPKESHHSTNSYATEEYQDSEENISPFKNTGGDHEPVENSRDVYQAENVQVEQNIGVTEGYETPNLYVHSKDLKDVVKGSQSNAMNHEEDNNLFHSQNNKASIYEIEKVPKINTNIEDIKKYIDVNDDFPKDEHETLQEEGEPLENNYGDELSGQLHTNQNTFVDADNAKHGFYEEFDLVSTKKNDSYEDYVIPKGENIYASEEATEPSKQDRPRNTIKNTINSKTNENSRFKVQYNNDLENVKPLQNSNQHEQENIKDTGDYKEVTDKSQEIKAKTESLWYNYDEQSSKTIKDERSKDKEITSEIPSTKKFKGTMIPTREYFKMSSPNYYISLPTVAERYDPYEPLPEKDRVRKVIKHFVNPPASINKKVRLI